MAYEPGFSDLLQSIDDATLEMDDPTPSSTYDLKITIFFGAIVLVAIYAWCLKCLDRKLSEDKDKNRTNGKKTDKVKKGADDVSNSSISDVSNSQEQLRDFSTPEELD